MYWGTMHIHADASPGAEWDAFVEATPGAALGHAAAWAGILQDAYGLSPRYLSARSGSGEIEGVLPLVRFRSLTGRRGLVSMPFLDTGGVLARSVEAERALVQAASEEARSFGARTVDLRQLEPLQGAPPTPDLNRVDLVMPLERDEETQWKALRAKVRNQTRKADKEGLRLAAGRSADLVRDFYRPFLINMRDLGSPVHAERFFAAAARAFGDRLRVIVTCLGDKPVGGLIAIRYADAVTVPWASTLRSERRRCPNNMIYWEALRWAVEKGAREFDFGRSPLGAGTYKFKKGWGAIERPLAWARLDSTGSFVPIGAADTSGALKKLSEVWTRLPLGLTASLGPHIRRYLSN